MSGLRIQRKADLYCHLPVIDFVVLDIASSFGHLEPPHVANRFLGAGNRISDRVVDALRRRTDQFNFLVNMVTHAVIFP